MATDPIEVRELRRETPVDTVHLTRHCPASGARPRRSSRVELIRRTAEAPSHFDSGAAAGPKVAAGGGVSTDDTPGAR